jgi:hypothetical protein
MFMSEREKQWSHWSREVEAGEGSQFGNKSILACQDSSTIYW